MDLLIRKPLEYEEAVFISLCCELSKYNRDHHPRQEDDMEGVLEARAERACRIFQGNDAKQLILMAVLDDEPVGYSMAHIYTPVSTCDNGTELTGVLDEIYIKQEANGKDIEKRLIEEVEKWVKDSGANRMRIHMYEWNDNLKKLCMGEGFKAYEVSFEKKLY